MPSVLLLLTLASSARAQEAGPWQAVLDTYVDDAGTVDYAALHAAHPLDAWLSQLASATEPTGPKARMAFWINAYNALTVDLVADNWPLQSIRDLDQGHPWTTRHFTVAGQDRTLDDIEKHLRAAGDPRVHAALNCASKGCPPLSRTALSGDTLDSQLDDAAARFIATDGMRIEAAAHKVLFNRIFDWYAADFQDDTDTDPPGLTGKLAEAASWAATHAPADQAAWLRAGGYQADWLEYDWRVNGR